MVRGKKQKYCKPILKTCRFFVFSGSILLLLFAFYFLADCPQAEASIILKIVGVNPSKENEQDVVLKALLPEEVMPEDVLDKADLDISFDYQANAYFVFGNFTLGPGETIEREVEIKDIWVIPEVEIETLRAEAKKTAQLLKGTEFHERAGFLQESIETKLDEIAKRQSMPAINPQRHISDYRDNLDLLAAAKADLVLGRSFLSQVKLLPSITVWKVFFSVIGLLGGLALGLYFLWYKQSKIITSPALGAAVSKEEDIVVPKQHAAKEDKKIGLEDIEDIIKEEKESPPE